MAQRVNVFTQGCHRQRITKLFISSLIERRTLEMIFLIYIVLFSFSCNAKRGMLYRHSYFFFFFGFDMETFSEVVIKESVIGII